MSSSKKSQTSSPTESPAMCESFFSKEQDKFLPIANVSRIMKKSLPPNAKISKEAKETVQECVSEFISFITGEASDKCHKEKRKTINGDDLLWAMTTLGFEGYVGPLKAYLSKYRETEGEKSHVARQDQDQDQDPNSNPNGGDFYSLSGQVNNPKSYEEMSGNMANIGYGESNNYGIGNSSVGNKYGVDGIGNASRAMASHLQHGIGW